MNAAQAKAIPMRDLLASLGHQPARERRGELWYLSPFRQEAEPSFKINPARNIWYDFGEGQGGNVLDFAMKYYQVSSIAEALRELERAEPGRSSTRSNPAQARLPLDGGDPASSTGPGLQVVKVQRLMNRALIEYLEKRGISLQTARPHVHEIYYTREGKNYFALAFKNQSGGYEMRNPYFKGTFGAKDVSVLGNWGAAPDAAIFEGFVDYLSALQLGAIQATTPAIVLNSASLKEKALRVTKHRGAGSVMLYLDHDPAGQELVMYFTQHLAHSMKVRDLSNLYAGYKDFNEYLQARGKEQRER